MMSEGQNQGWRWQSPTPTAEQARVLALLERYGTAATSFQILEPGYKYWFDPGGEGVVAFVECGRYRVVAGGPVCASRAMAAHALAFVEAAHRGGKKVVWVGVDDDDLTHLKAGITEIDSLVIGLQPEWDPADYSLEGPSRRSLRSQVNRARNKGVRIRRVMPEELANAPGALRASIEHVMTRWLASRKAGVLRFMVDLAPFTFCERRRYYLAEAGDESIGFLAAVPVYGRRGWFLEDVIRVPDAPNGTAEYLIHTAMMEAHVQGDQFVTLGVSPLAALDASEYDTGSKTLQRAARWLRTLYNFDGLRQFKSRFKPHRWTPSHLVTIKHPLRFGALWATARAFTGPQLGAFLLDTLRRSVARIPAKRWSLLLTLQAILLIPWTFMLGRVDGQKWFGDPSIQSAWVIFDLALCLSLLGLARLVRKRRPSARPLSMLLAGACMADFILSMVQSLHLHVFVTGWAAVFVLAGIVGPFVATTVLATIATVTPIERRR